MPREDPIIVECVNCGYGHRWIPKEIEDHIQKLEDQIVELKNELELELSLKELSQYSD